MVRLRILLPAILLTALPAAAQIPAQITQSVAVANTPSAQEVKDMAQLAELLADPGQVSFDSGHLAFTMHGPAGAVELATWLIHAMDKPAGFEPSAQDNANPASNLYTMPPGGDPSDNKRPLLEIYYLVNTKQPFGWNEVLATMRVVGNLPKVFGYSETRMIAFRGTAAEVSMADWMIKALASTTVLQT